MTPGELSIYVIAYSNRIKSQQEENILQAYFTATWSRSKKLPNIEKILNKLSPPKEMSNEEMLNKVKMLNAMFGGEVKVDGN